MSTGLFDPMTGRPLTRADVIHRQRADALAAARVQLKRFYSAEQAHLWNGSPWWAVVACSDLHFALAVAQAKVNRERPPQDPGPAVVFHLPWWLYTCGWPGTVDALVLRLAMLPEVLARSDDAEQRWAARGWREFSARATEALYRLAMGQSRDRLSWSIIESSPTPLWAPLPPWLDTLDRRHPGTAAVAEYRAVQAIDSDTRKALAGRVQQGMDHLSWPWLAMLASVAAPTWTDWTRTADGERLLSHYDILRDRFDTSSIPQPIPVAHWGPEHAPSDEPRHVVATTLVQTAIQTFGRLLDRALQL